MKSCLYRQSYQCGAQQEAVLKKDVDVQRAAVQGHGHVKQNVCRAQGYVQTCLNSFWWGVC